MSPEVLIILGIIVGVGLVLAVLIMRITARIDAECRAATHQAIRDRAEADAQANKYYAEAAADRRALEASMDAFRAEMRRLEEPRSHPERAAPTPGAHH